jgi:hypothetical protein
MVFRGLKAAATPKTGATARDGVPWVMCDSAVDGAMEDVGD